MTREEKIQAIYEKIADKTLSFGCKYIWKTSWWDTYTREYILWNEIIKWGNNYLYSYENNRVINIISTIWHPVMIWDYLDWQEDNYEIIEKLNESDLTIIWLWTWKRKPIEEQSEECIDYIYNLIN